MAVLERQIINTIFFFNLRQLRNTVLSYELELASSSNKYIFVRFEHTVKIILAYVYKGDLHYHPLVYQDLRPSYC